MTGGAETTQTFLYSGDLLNFLSETKVRDYDNLYVINLMDQGNISNPQNTILEQVAEFYYRNKTNSCGKCLEYASQLVNESSKTIPGYRGMVFKIDEKIIFKQKLTQKEPSQKIGSSTITFVKINKSEFHGPFLAEVSVWQ